MVHPGFHLVCLSSKSGLKRHKESSTKISTEILHMDVESSQKLHVAVTIHLGKVSVLKINEDKSIHPCNYHTVAFQECTKFKSMSLTMNNSKKKDALRISISKFCE